MARPKMKRLTGTAARSALAGLILALAVAFSATGSPRAAAAPDLLVVNLSVGPGAVLADGGTYETLFLRLEDESGVPFPFPDDRETEVSVWSSDESLFSVPRTIIVPPGSVAATVPVTVTLKAGSGNITAAVADVGAATATLQTVSSTGAIPPFQLRLELAPAVMPEQSAQPGRFVISLRGDEGAAVVAAEDVVVAVTSSNPENAQPTQSTYTIPGGANAVFGEYFVGAEGTATLTAQANGFATAQSEATVTRRGLIFPPAPTPLPVPEGTDVEPVEIPPPDPVPTEATQLSLSVIPERFMPGPSSALVVAQALDGNGLPATFTCDPVNVTTDFVDGITVRDGVAVPTGYTCAGDATFAVGTIDSSASPSPTRITVSQSGLTGATVEVAGQTRSVAGFDLSFVYPTTSPGAAPSNYLVARLLDESGSPASATSETPLFLFSESVELPNAASFLPGESLKAFPVTVSGGSGTASVSGVLPGAESVLAETEIADAALQINVSLNPSTVAAGQTAAVTAVVTLGDRPVQGAILIWRTTSGELLNTSAVTDESGIGRADFIPADGLSQAIVGANFGGVAAEAPPVQVQVITSFDSSRGLPSITIFGIPLPFPLLLTFSGALIVLYLGYRILPGTRLAGWAQGRYDRLFERLRQRKNSAGTRGE